MFSTQHNGAYEIIQNFEHFCLVPMVRCDSDSSVRHVPVQSLANSKASDETCIDAVFSIVLETSTDILDQHMQIVSVCLS